MAREVLDKEGYENTAALIPIEEVLFWMRDLTPDVGEGLSE